MDKLIQDQRYREAQAAKREAEQHTEHRRAAVCLFVVGCIIVLFHALLGDWSGVLHFATLSAALWAGFALIGRLLAPRPRRKGGRHDF